MTEFAVRNSDVTTVPSDLLLLKHAQNFYGVDEAVANRLISAKLCTEAELSPAPGDFVVIETQGTIAPIRAMFLGTPPLRNFTYGEMFQFAFRAIEKIADLRLRIRTIPTTVHGTGYGLDGGESIQRLIGGFQAGLSQYNVPTIERVSFLTLEDRAARMLNSTLEAMTIGEPSSPKITRADCRRSPDDVSDSHAATSPVNDDASRPVSSSMGTTAVRKKRVFVALPYSEEFQNVYDFGIYPAVRKCGYICERVDETHFAGDVLARIREGIEAASLVVADLTEGRPNVYLEVGYAWGKSVPVIFIARKGEQLHFDVSTHRCIFYGRFTQFAKDLEDLIRGIDTPRHGS